MEEQLNRVAEQASEMLKHVNMTNLIYFAHKWNATKQDAILYLEQQQQKYFDKDIIIYFLLVIIFFLWICTKFDLPLFYRPIWYELTTFRFPNFLRTITFQKHLVLNDKNLYLSKEEGKIMIGYERVNSTDVDLMFHCNNSKYLLATDYHRFYFLQQTGLFHAALKHNMWFVTAAQTIRYRREINWGVKYKIVTKCLGHDEKAIFIEHLFMCYNKKTKQDEVHAIQLVREGITVPRALREKNPLTDRAPISFIINDCLGWNLPERIHPPSDFKEWLDSLHGQYKRVIPADQQHHHHADMKHLSEKHHHNHHDKQQQHQHQQHNVDDKKKK